MMFLKEILLFCDSESKALFCDIFEKHCIVPLYIYRAWFTVQISH